MELLQKVIKTVKDNLSLVAIIPLVLGGLWQILSLAGISTSYIRFFSVTQQIADGILILFFILVILLTIYINSKIIPYPKNLSTAELVKEKNTKLILRFFSLCICLFLTYIFLTGPVYESITSNQSFELTSILSIIFGAYFPLIILYLMGMYLIALLVKNIIIPFKIKIPPTNYIKAIALERVGDYNLD